ncbi:ribonuclease D [Alteromonas aestuariivivens]|uniref:Ribonuclease D n=1 Tax=Alteromonas aestuariivivens TaxID=1938339 RepID=A0A3D8M4H8_9ALTE|nr:ribonuclease D [Alteromonas aestuariivivens]RDV24643.1 ribonuclease D [Alteromonas aestuariivivens]
MDYELVNSDIRLREVCEQAECCPAVALDTEFVRTRTLMPQLGLIQLYDGKQLVLIDPLEIQDFSPFVHLMQNQRVVKVLHSCSEDLETFLAAFDVVPIPLFDTQFAAGVLEIGTTMGYAKLVEELCGVMLDKGESRTDWLARPLSQKQLAYAANDVLYLLPAFLQLDEQITQHGKRQWVFDEMASLAEKKRANMPLEYAYLQVKNNWRLSSKQLNVLQHLAAWRLSVAREKDLALNFVFKESQLFEVALYLPASKAALSRIHGLPPQVLRRYGQTVLKIVESALEEFAQMPQGAHLPRVKRLVDVSQYKKTLAAVKDIAASLATQQGVSAEVLASKKQMNQLLKWWWFDIEETRALGIMPDLLSGWRRELFMPALIDLLGPMPESGIQGLSQTIKQVNV